MKAVHVELPNEGSVVVVFEKVRYQLLGEFVLVKNNEGVALFGPPDQVRVLVVVQEARRQSARGLSEGSCQDASALAGEYMRR